MSLYCLKTPDGKLLWRLIDDSEKQVRFDAYGVHASIDSAWGARFWKRWPASWNSLYRLGYRVVPVVFREAEQ